ncbi:hypothetical protein [Quisquiliibacterium transsilvanicum]|uniref:Uncharacterized protein n=1 Tax=Quisquiliibacterium transsilvanicum TaxID=1549638 RepID=A0A7W8M840_9BURK|nr:hypothetical protein [Quisquiliibacterium transsilvanicum]MBB5270569.1 hypothetical protein [Quisquiliibacterium transsilvanicum]
MICFRHGLLALLVLLQLLAPYLHTHASASAAGGLHMHLPSAAGQFAETTGQHALRAGQHAATGGQRDSAAAAPAFHELALAQRPAIDSAGESPAFEMPVEWRRDQPKPVFVDAALLPVRAPPATQRSHEPLPMLAEARPAQRPFAVLAYPAAAPPAVPVRC